MGIARTGDQADRDEQAALWYLNMVDDALSSDDRDRLDLWLSEADNLLAFEQAGRLWKEVDDAAATSRVIQLRSIALEDFRRLSQRRWTRHFLRPAAVWGSNAAILLAIIGSTALYLYQPTQSYRTGIGESRVVVLRDGSVMSLDADSEVVVRLGRDRRDLMLTHGRAKFDVAADPLRPFTVTAAGKMVVATGTSFSVELLRTQFLATLYEGHVAVLNQKDETSLLKRQMLPGDQLTVALGGRARPLVAAIDPVGEMTWTTTLLSFDNEPIAAAVERVNRHSRTKIVVASSVGDVPVNGVFKAGNTDAFVEAVTTLNPVEAIEGNGQILLVRKHE